MNQYSITNATYHYPGPRGGGFADLSFNITKGEFISLVGEAGQGKSSLLRLLSGVLAEAYGGEGGGSAVFVDDDLFAPLKHDKRIQIAFLAENPESSRLFRSVKREFRFGLENRNLNREEIKNEIASSCEKFQLNALIEKNTDAISTGELTRVMLAAAAATRPAVLLLDQPLASLSDEYRTNCLGILAEINREQKTTIVVSGLTEAEARHYATRVLAISGGNIEYDGAVSEYYRDRTVTAQSAPCILTPCGTTAVSSVRDLKFQYDRFNFDLYVPHLELYSGSITALTGSNGAGKTTLLKLLGGVLKPSSGMCGYPERTFYLPADPARTLACDTVIDEIELGFRSSKFIYDDRLLEKILDIFELRELLDCHPRDLSFFQRYSVALSSLAVLKPALLLLDEPTRGAGVKGRKALSELFGLLCSEFGTAIVCASNDVEFVSNCVHRNVELSGGTIASDRSFVQ